MIAFQPLPYAQDALEPFIDARTVEIHYTKHHKGYYDKLIAALEASYKEGLKKPVLELLTNLTTLPREIQTTVRNNAGGLWAHDFYWRCMRPGGTPLRKGGALEKALTRDFGSVEAFEKMFKKNAAELFGSGWTWLIKDSAGKLSVLQTTGHYLPQMQGAYEPLLVVDVWEHAYYLKYQNRRAEYIDNWWKLVDWERAESLLTGNTPPTPS